MWIVLAACIALLIGLLAWGVFGAVTTSISTTGVVERGQTICFLSADDIAKVNVGDAATVGGVPVKVARVAEVPHSRDEAREVLSSDYLVSALLKDEWAYQVEFEGDTSQLNEGVPLKVSITTERIAPICLFLRPLSPW